MVKTGEIIIFAQAMVQVEPDVGLIEKAIIEKYGEEEYAELIVDLGFNVFIGLLSGEFDLSDEGEEINWEDVDYED